jgi:hypothetical protein
MRGQPIVTDARVVDQAALHHVPAHRSLQPPEHEHPQQLRNQRWRNPAPQQKVDEWQQEDQPDQTSENAVPVFPIEDALELCERHLVVNLLVFGGFLVFLEGLVPFGRIERRNDPDNRLPLDDRQAGMGQTCDATDYQNGEDHGTANQQPERNLSASNRIHDRSPG